MLQVKLVVSIIIAVRYFYIGEPEIGHVSDKMVPHALPFLFGNGPLFFVHKLINKEIQFIAQFFGEIVSEERCVIIEFANFEHLFAAGSAGQFQFFPILLAWIVPALFDVLKYLVAEIIRIQLSLVRRNNAGMKLRE